MKKNWQSNNNWPKKKNVNSMGRIFLQNNNNIHNIHLHTQAESKHTKNETNYDVDDDDDDGCTELYQTKWINKKQQQHI